MHEQALIKDIINKIVQEAQHHKAKKVLKLKVKVGRLSHFTAQSFREHFYHAAQNTSASNAVLEINIFPAVAQCINCKEKFELNLPQASCPLCHSTDFAIITGKEVLVESMELA